MSTHGTERANTGYLRPIPAILAIPNGQSRDRYKSKIADNAMRLAFLFILGVVLFKFVLPYSLLLHFMLTH